MGSSPATHILIWAVTGMTDDVISQDGLYRLMTWLSPAFPVGSFSYSHGLEWAVAEALVHDEATLMEWIGAGLTFGFGRVDGSLFAASHRATTARDEKALVEAHALAVAMVSTREFELETMAQGRAFWSTLVDVWARDETVVWAKRHLTSRIVPYPFAVGVATAAAQVPLRSALVSYLHAVTSNLVSAGIRLVPLGQTAGQRVLSKLQDSVSKAADEALTRPLEDIGSAAPLFEWASMRHETQFTRLFRS
jgi:urease accessory protein